MKGPRNQKIYIFFQATAFIDSQKELLGDIEGLEGNIWHHSFYFDKSLM